MFDDHDFEEELLYGLDDLDHAEELIRKQTDNPLLRDAFDILEEPVDEKMTAFEVTKRLPDRWNENHYTLEEVRRLLNWCPIVATYSEPVVDYFARATDRDYYDFDDFLHIDERLDRLDREFSQEERDLLVTLLRSENRTRRRSELSGFDEDLVFVASGLDFVEEQKDVPESVDEKTYKDEHTEYHLWIPQAWRPLEVVEDD